MTVISTLTPKHLLLSTQGHISQWRLSERCNELTWQTIHSFGAAVFYQVMHIKRLALQTNRNITLVSATVLRAALYYSLETIKQSGGCDKVTQENTGEWTVPTPRATTPAWLPSGPWAVLRRRRWLRTSFVVTRDAFKRSTCFSGALHGNTWHKYGWGYYVPFNKGFLVLPKNFLRHWRSPRTGTVAATFSEGSKSVQESWWEETKAHQVILRADKQGTRTWDQVQPIAEGGGWQADCCGLLPKPQGGSRPSLFPWEYGELSAASEGQVMGIYFKITPV